VPQRRDSSCFVAYFVLRCIHQPQQANHDAGMETAACAAAYVVLRRNVCSRIATHRVFSGELWGHSTGLRSGMGITAQGIA